eukprot:3889397-Prymnesium_polylepis.3
MVYRRRRERRREGNGVVHGYGKGIRIHVAAADSSFSRHGDRPASAEMLTKPLRTHTPFDCSPRISRCEAGCPTGSAGLLNALGRGREACAASARGERGGQHTGQHAGTHTHVGAMGFERAPTPAPTEARLRLPHTSAVESDSRSPRLRDTPRETARSS